MKEFIYTVKPTRVAMLSDGPTEKESTILSQHAAYVEGLAKQGVLELAGRTQNADETTFGLVIFRAESQDAAKQIMLEDPAVRQCGSNRCQ